MTFARGRRFYARVIVLAGNGSKHARIGRSGSYRPSDSMRRQGDAQDTFVVNLTWSRLLHRGISRTQIHHVCL